MNTAALYDTEKEIQKNDLSISQRLAGTCKRYDSTMKEKRDRKGFVGEGGRGVEHNARRITRLYMLRAFGPPGFRFARSFCCAPFPRKPSPTFCQPWTLLRKALIRAGKTSYTAGRYKYTCYLHVYQGDFKIYRVIFCSTPVRYLPCCWRRTSRRYLVSGSFGSIRNADSRSARWCPRYFNWNGQFFRRFLRRQICRYQRRYR
jgi:hypothetical protein